MKTYIAVIMLVIATTLVILLSVREARTQSQTELPKYCCTEAGTLGPYDNKTVPEGGACFGTKDGKRYDGTACYGNVPHSTQDSGQNHQDGYPQYCCTGAGKLGPYTNTSTAEGAACFGTKDGKRYDGTACY